MALLVTVEPTTNAVLTSDEAVTALIAQATAVAQGMVEGQTVETAAGREALKSTAYQVARTKTAVDDLGKALVADAKKRVAEIDGRRKTWRDAMDALRDRIRQPLTDWEQAAQKAAEEEARREAAALREAQQAQMREAEALRKAAEEARQQAEAEAKELRRQLAAQREAVAAMAPPTPTPVAVPFLAQPELPGAAFAVAEAFKVMRDASTPSPMLTFAQMVELEGAVIACENQQMLFAPIFRAALTELQWRRS